MPVSAVASLQSSPNVDISAFIDSAHPQSWSRQMVGLLHAGHYREAYEILAQRVPFVENQLRPLAEALAGNTNHWTMICDWIDRYLDHARPQRILDVGCAVGCHAIHFARKGHQAWGIDILPSMIERGRELVESLELSERIHLLEGDIRHLERHFEAGFFDSAVACDIFEHLDDESLLQVMAGLRQVVRPGGRIVIQTSPGRHYYWFEPDRWKLLALLIPMAWLPDGAFSAYVRAIDRWIMQGLRKEPAAFYRHEYGHINCLDKDHLKRLMREAGLSRIETFAVHAHPGFKDEGCLRRDWLKALFGRKSIASRNIFGVARV